MQKPQIFQMFTNLTKLRLQNKKPNYTN